MTPQPKKTRPKPVEEQAATVQPKLKRERGAAAGTETTAKDPAPPFEANSWDFMVA